MQLYEYELGKAAEVLTKELLGLKPGETLVITGDTESDIRVIEATARAAFALGAKPMVVLVPAPLGVGKLADPMLPLNPLIGALSKADVWVEFNNQWLLYSTPYEVAMRENTQLRHLCLVGMDADMMVRCIGRINFPALVRFQEAFTERLERTKHVRITSPAGTNVEFDHAADHPIRCHLGYAHRPGSEMLAGQISVAPEFSSIHGTIVFDGSLVPPLGLLKHPIQLQVTEGQITEITGGKEARMFQKWLTELDDPQMFKLAHVSYGFNPGARLTGNILEDERVWGGTEWGIGSVGASLVPPEGIPGPSHCDGTCLDSSIWLDGTPVTQEGEVIDEVLVALAREVVGT